MYSLQIFFGTGLLMDLTTRSQKRYGESQLMCKILDILEGVSALEQKTCAHETVQKIL